ncbi:MAG: hypothetical protein ABW110_13350 [Steroidobacteraceae bacterium]
MSGIVKKAWKGSKKIGNTITGGLFDPKTPELPDVPKAPQLDEAAQKRDMQDRIRRRRGVFANIFAGSSTKLGE